MLNKPYLNVATIIITIAATFSISIATFFIFSSSQKNPHQKIFIAVIDDVKKVYVTNVERSRHGNSIPNVLREKLFKGENLSKFPLARKKKGLLGSTTKNYKNAEWQSDYQKRTAKGSIHYKFMSTGKGPKARMVCIPHPLILKKEKGSGPEAFGFKDKFPHVFSLTNRTSKWGTIIYRCYITGDSPKINKVFE